VESTLIIAGVVFVGAAIVGGGLVAFKVEVPLVDSLARQVLLGVFGTILLVSGFVFGDEGGAFDEAAPTMTSLGALPAAGSESLVSTTATTTTVTATSEPEAEWVLVLDGDGKLGVSIPGYWSVVVTEDAIWASEDVDEWMAAVEGEGPASHNGYYARRISQPVTGTFAEIAEQYLEEMPVPSQCALIGGDVERPGGGYFTYLMYDCSPGGQFVNEVEIGINPPWVTLESSRYLSDATREDILSRIWNSFRAY
jgi:hypothetical protein